MKMLGTADKLCSYHFFLRPISGSFLVHVERISEMLPICLHPKSFISKSLIEWVGKSIKPFFFGSGYEGNLVGIFHYYF
jgi:hypothetical protein